MTSDIDHDQLDHIGIGEAISSESTDGQHYARAYHTDQELRGEPFTPVAVDACALLRDISRGDTITAAAHDTDTLETAVTAGDAAKTAKNLADMDDLQFADVYATFLRDAFNASTSEVASMTDIDAPWVTLTAETTNAIIQDIMDAEDEAEDDDGDDGEAVDMSPRDEFQTTLGYAAGTDIRH
jgi:hypothetical protein